MRKDKISSNLLEGLKRALPIDLGYLPVGFAFGVLAVKNGVSAQLAIFMSLLMYSGSGQLVFVSLWGAHTNVLSIIAAVGIINLRYLLQSAAEAPWMTDLPRFKRFLLGLGITDETFAVHVTALQKGWKRSLLTMFVTNHVAQLGWILGTILGIFCGGLIQDIRPLGLDYALTAMFLALLILQLHSRLHIVVAIVTVVISAWLKVSGVSQWNIALATIIGATLGACIVMRQDKERR